MSILQLFVLFGVAAVAFLFGYHRRIKIYDDIIMEKDMRIGEYMARVEHMKKTNQDLPPRFR